MEKAFKHAKLGHVHKLKDLIIKFPKLLTEFNEELGKTLLMVAVINSQWTVANMLLQHNPNKHINLKSSDGKTALIYAVLNHDFLLIQLLLSYNPNLNIKYKQKTAFQHAKDMKAIQILSLFENKSKILKKYLNIQGLRTAQNGAYVDKMIKLHDDFEKNYKNIGYASLITSQHFIKSVPNFEDFSHITSKLQPLKSLSIMRFKEIEKKWNKLFENISNESINQFQKKIQWPHMPLLFLDKGLGSCVDLVLIKLMLYERKGIKYDFELYTGLNTLMSHAELFTSSKQESHTLNKSLMFTIFSLYHVFRFLQFVRHGLEEPAAHKVELETVQTLRYIIEKIIPSKKLALEVFTFILSRESTDYKKCVQIYKRRQITAPKK